MQLAQQVSQHTLDEYVGGEVTLSNDNGVPSLVRGKLTEIRLDDNWAQIVMTCDAHATGALEDADRINWKRSNGGKAPVILRPNVRVDNDGTLRFLERSPQGSIVIVKRP